MIQDLHSHTLYSYCGKDYPREVVEAAIAGGIEMLGICDHSYGVGCQRDYTNRPDRQERLWDYQRCINAYLQMLRDLQLLYRDKIVIKCGIEVPTATLPEFILPREVDISGFDYCLIEHIDHENTVAKDLFAFAERCACPKVGIAHTDMPSFLDAKGIDKLLFFTEMAQRGIFWELNVNYDSIHGYREHAYVERFFADKPLQEIILKSGVELSIGFDGHRVKEYLPERVTDYCRRLEALSVPMMYSENE